MLPGWAVRLFVGALLLAPLVVAVDALAAVAPGARADPDVAALDARVRAAARHHGAVRARAGRGRPHHRDARRARLAGRAAARRRPRCWPSRSCSCSRGSGCARSCCGWWARPQIRRRPPRASSCCSSRSLAAIVVWIRNPYAAALLAPALHVWLFALARGPAHAPRRCASRSWWSGSLPVAIVAFVVARALGLGGLDAAWELLLVVAGGHVSLRGAAAVEPARGLRGRRGDDRLARSRARRRSTASRSPSAARAPTPARARSAAPSRLCESRAPCGGSCGRSRRC